MATRKSDPGIPKSARERKPPDAGGGPLAMAGKLDNDPSASLEQGARRSAWIDPYLVALALEHVENGTHHTAFGCKALRESARNPWAEAIIKHRCSQMAQLMRPKYNPSDVGFTVVPRDRKHAPTKAEDKRAWEITEFLRTCGAISDPYRKYDPRRERLTAFARKVTRDSMILEGMCFEVMRNDWTGEPRGFVSVDAGTIWFTKPDDAQGEIVPEKAAFVQRLDDKPRVFFAADEMYYGIRNPSTELDTGGYGMPELFELSMVMTGLMYGWSWNANFFKNGGLKGFLAVMGKMSEPQLDELKREVMWMATGVRNAHRVPIVNPYGDGADLKWVQTGTMPDDLQFEKWIDANFRLMCSGWQIEPDEVGFHYGQIGVKSTLSQSGIEDKVQFGKSKGLNTLAACLEDGLNDFVVSDIDPDFEVKIIPDDTMSEKEKEELIQARLKRRTLNEERAQQNDPPLPWGDVVLDPQAMQAKQAWDANQQGGDDDQGGGNGDDEGGQGGGGGEQDDQGGQADDEIPDWARNWKPDGDQGGADDRAPGAQYEPDTNARTFGGAEPPAEKAISRAARARSVAAKALSLTTRV